MKIAVTSASGQLGSAIVKQLIEEIGKEQVIGIARTPKKAEHLGVETRKGDYNHREDFEAALQGVDKVLLVSGMDAPEKRIGQHRNVIEAAKANGVKKIVYTSIIGDENKTAFQPIVQSNRQTEEDVKNSGLDWAIGRNGIYIEPDLEYLDHYRAAGKSAIAPETESVPIPAERNWPMPTPKCFWEMNTGARPIIWRGKPLPSPNWPN